MATTSTPVARDRVRTVLGAGATLALVGLIVYLASERMYWDHSASWFTTRAADSLIGAAYYGFGVAGALWLLGRAPFRGVHQVVLAGAVFGWTIEGIVVYVIHEAGPLDPVFPAMFVGWHGLVSFAGFFYLVRRFGLDGNTRAMTVLAASLGAVFGLWATTAFLADGGAVVPHGFAEGAPSALGFAAYAVLLTAVLAAAHILLGFVWPRSWRPGRTSGWIVGGLTAAYAALGFLVIPWGPVRLAVLMAVPVIALTLANRNDTAPTFFPALAGHVDRSSLKGLVALPLVATALYAAVALSGAGPLVGETAQWALVMVQVAGGGVALGWAVWRSIRPRITSGGTVP